MTERPVENPIDIDQVEAERQQTIEEISGLRTLISEKLTPPDSMLEFMGEAFTGQRQRRVVDSDGKIQTMPWTMESISDATSEADIAEQQAEREELTGRLEIGFSAQETYYTTSRSRNKERGLNAVRFGRLLVQRYMDRELQPRHRFEEIEEGLKNDQETLEMLETALLPGIPYSSRESVTNNYLTKNISLRVGKEWPGVLRKVETVLLEKVKHDAARASTTTSQVHDMTDRLVRNGERIVSEDLIDSWGQQAEVTREVAEEISQMTQFDEVLPWIKDRWGEDADFDSLPWMSTISRELVSYQSIRIKFS